MNDINLMLGESIQDYYGSEYQSYQRKVIENNSGILEDQIMIKKFISETKIFGNIVDIGSGDGQWFPLFENKVNNYFAIDVNKKALSLLPLSKRLTTISGNVFAREFELSSVITQKIDFAFFSFFLSHFSDASIRMLFEKLNVINSVIIVDSLWGNKHREKYANKELKEIVRKISPTDNVSLPKRFFEYVDIEGILKPFGYSIAKFIEGNYWFVCIAQKLGISYI